MAPSKKTINRLEAERKEAKKVIVNKATHSALVLQYLQDNYPGFKKLYRADKHRLDAHLLFDNSWRVNLWERIPYGYKLVHSWFMVFTGDDGISYSNPKVEEIYGLPSE